jgi:hypothetical protein
MALDGTGWRDKGTRTHASQLDLAVAITTRPRAVGTNGKTKIGEMAGLDPIVTSSMAQLRG